MRRTASEDVYEALKGDILALRRKPGSEVSINEIADERGLSRSPVRDALMRLADEALKYAVTIPTGQWIWEFLPLHLCSISVFIAFFHAVSGSVYLAEYLYAVSLPTALMALVFPDWMNLPLINIMCFHSFSIHILIALYPAMLLSGGFRPSFRRLIRLVPFIVLYGVAIYFVNNALGTNFFFMNGPAEGNPLTILERYIGGWYRIAFPIIAAIVWTIMYLPFSRPARS